VLHGIKGLSWTVVVSRKIRYSAEKAGGRVPKSRFFESAKAP
jgi:hypothetical protein